MYRQNSLDTKLEAKVKLMVKSCFHRPILASEAGLASKPVVFHRGQTNWEDLSYEADKEIMTIMHLCQSAASGSIRGMSISETNSYSNLEKFYLCKQL